MWQLISPTTQKIKLDLSASGQSSTSASQLLEGSLQIINVVEHVPWEKPDLQFLICETCGIIGCQAGNWVNIKRSESLVLITPAFTLLSEVPKGLKHEYMPPNYLLEKGTIFISQEFYTTTLRKLVDFPNFDTLEPLVTWEAAKIFQLEAPHHILGDIRTAPKLLEDIVIASSEGNFMEQTNHLVKLIEQLLCKEQPTRVRPVAKHDQVIAFYLDMAGIPEWKALAYNGSKYSLYLEPGYVIDH